MDALTLFMGMSGVLATLFVWLMPIGFRAKLTLTAALCLAAGWQSWDRMKLDRSRQAEVVLWHDSLDQYCQSVGWDGVTRIEGGKVDSAISPIACYRRGPLDESGKRHYQISGLEKAHCISKSEEIAL